jgi:hypothetical protein
MEDDVKIDPTLIKLAGMLIELVLDIVRGSSTKEVALEALERSHEFLRKSLTVEGVLEGEIAGDAAFYEKFGKKP